MRSVALLPAIAILAGVAGGIAWAGDVPRGVPVLVCLWIGGCFAWIGGRGLVVTVAVTTAYLLAGVMLGATAARDALEPGLRAVADTSGEPVRLRARLVEDAAQRDFGVLLVARVEAVERDESWRTVEGGVRLTVSGTQTERSAEWRAGRVIEAPAALRRPVRYLNDGVPDFERDLALRGIALNGTVKSGLLVEVVEQGGAIDEAAATVRAHVRASIARHVGRVDPVAGAIVTAILIGDRTALPDEVRERLQAAGTYHVIAISGGNIAILAAFMAGVLLLAGVSGRGAALVIICGLLAYARVVSVGPSVWRATATAVVYFAARLADHRSPPWNAMAVSAAFLACLAPLDVRDAGFALTFAATAAILEAARRTPPERPLVVRWLIATVTASLAAEIVLLPISATAFSRITSAGLVLNLLAIPLMTIAQIAGLATSILDRVEWAAAPAGLVAAIAARGLVDSARLVDLVPWLSFRVPPPAAVFVAGYYVALGVALWWPPRRRIALVVFACCAAAILTGATARFHRDNLAGRLRLTMFDVGQGEALLLQTPDRQAVMVDAGGVGFDGTAFDIGGRVLAPALWARGVTKVNAFAITHGDPDHIGGASALVRDFSPREIWAGIPVPAHRPLRMLLAQAAGSGSRVESRLAGWSADRGSARIRVLHPPAPDWERLRVRNDDSLVLEIRYGDVAILLTGDIGAEVERSLLPMLSPAPIRVLKVAHHGSRTSTSQELLDAWTPHVALISCGRENRFGHPAPDVIRRLESAGTRIYRTDRDGQITLDTDGRALAFRTFVGHEATGHEGTKDTKENTRR